MGIERLNEFWPEWRVQDNIGSGHYGTVYKVIDSKSVCSAVKVISIPSSEADLNALRSEGMSDSDSRTYFKDIVDDFANEIKLMNSLKGYRNIISVEAFKIIEKKDTIGWDIFIRMELLHPFDSYIKSHVPTEDEVVKLGVDIATALEACQQKNIIHRDIKPANILIDDFGNFKLGDFGVAKELEKTTGAMSIKGTPYYMAPEVTRGYRYNNTVDIYSLGLVMYFLLNNSRHPFVDVHKSEITYTDKKRANDRRLSGEPLPPPCNASPGLSDIILMACSYDPAKRFLSATAFKNALLYYKNSPDMPIFAANNVDPEETVAVARKAPAETAAASYKSNAGSSASVQSIAMQPQKEKTGVLAAISRMFAKDKETVTKTNDNSFYPAISSSSKVGDIVTFGHYEQDNDLSNGAEPIEWKVLAKHKGSVLLISNYALDCKKYNKRLVSNSWETSDIKKWLNNKFYDIAFTEEEKSRIYCTKYDKVFLFSVGQIEKYLSSNSERCCNPTKYAIAHGTYIHSNRNCCWWLQSPGKDSKRAMGIDQYGNIIHTGIYMNCDYYSVRPGICVTVGEDKYEKPAQKVQKAEKNTVSKDIEVEREKRTEKVEKTNKSLISENVNIGDIITFGQYKQNNRDLNGLEKIEWLVLAKDNEKALVTSKYALDCKRYNDELEAVTWETSSIRKWLNDEFYNTAFSEDERDNIKTTYLVNNNNPRYGTNGGNDTSDKVFLLGIDEVEKYFSSGKIKRCMPTNYTVTKGVYTSSDGNCCWWLRSPGASDRSTAYVYTNGYAQDYGLRVNVDYAIRPAMWVRIGEGKTEKTVVKSQETKKSNVSSNLNIGDIITLGRYRQNDKKSDDLEDIEWLVLAKDNEKALVTSKYALDCKRYNEKYESVTWETSSIRKWLNEYFYNSVFNDTEKGKIRTMYVVNSDNPIHRTKGGNITTDKVFLLSSYEAKLYFKSDKDRKCNPTPYAASKGVITNNHDDCWWWLRSPGYFNKNAASVDTCGGVIEDGNLVTVRDYAIRPALWINL